MDLVDLEQNSLEYYKQSTRPQLRPSSPPSPSTRSTCSTRTATICPGPARTSDAGGIVLSRVQPLLEFAIQKNLLAYEEGACTIFRQTHANVHSPTILNECNNSKSLRCQEFRKNEGTKSKIFCMIEKMKKSNLPKICPTKSADFAICSLLHDLFGSQIWLFAILHSIVCENGACCKNENRKCSHLEDGLHSTGTPQRRRTRLTIYTATSLFETQKYFEQYTYTMSYYDVLLPTPRFSRSS